MKNITVRSVLVILLATLVVSSVSLIRVEGKTLENCETALTKLNWSDTVDLIM